MSMLSSLVGPGIGLIGSLMGGGNEMPDMPPELRQVYEFLMRSARGARRFGNSIPMSRPQERYALAQDRGLLGQMQTGNRDRIYGAMRGVDEGNTGDLMSNLGSQDIAQMMSLDSSHLLNALAARQQAKFQTAPGLAQQAGGAASQGYGAGLAGAQHGQQQNRDLFGSLGQLAQQIAFSNARKPQQAPQMGGVLPAPSGGYGFSGGMDQMRNQLRPGLDTGNIFDYTGGRYPG